VISSDTSGLPVAALAGATALPPGTVLDGYRLDTMIAQGGFGQVYRATTRWPTVARSRSRSCTASCAARRARSRGSCARPR
jgi:hypothetical protein